MDNLYIQRIRDGDADAFRYFIKTYRDMAFTIAMSVLKDDQIAEEVVQDAFLKAYNGLAKFNQQSKFSTWFYRIVTNEALQRLKKSKKELMSFIENYHDEPADESFLLSLDAKDQEYLINEALNRLSSNEGLALRLFYLEENSLKDVAVITGWSESNTKVILHRARRNMLVLLNKPLKAR